ncbi:MAG: phosphotransferase, partial [Anaerolineae bacterium]|nr:phosphotransferase [Anaerolineae bacterium]
LSWIQSELVWLAALRRDTPLGVPEPITAPDGNSVVFIPVDGLDAPLVCALFRWMDGEARQPDTITLQETYQAGVFLARLHEYSRRYTPPPEFERPRFDGEGLFGDDSVYNPGAGAALFSDEQRWVFSQVAERMRRVMDEQDAIPGAFGLIHADFLVKNMLFHQGEVRALDFDECGWGYYLYDIAPALWQFKDQPRYADLRAAYWDGYTSVRQMPDGTQSPLEAFLAARHLASIRWIAGNRDNPVIRGRAGEIITVRTELLRRFLDTGRLAG